MILPSICFRLSDVSLDLGLLEFENLVDVGILGFVKELAIFLYYLVIVLLVIQLLLISAINANIYYYFYY